MNLINILANAVFFAIPYSIPYYYFQKDLVKSAFFGILSGAVAVLIATFLNSFIGNFSVAAANILTLLNIIIAPWLINKISSRLRIKEIWIIAIASVIITLILMNLLYGKTMLLQSIIQTPMTLGMGPFG